MRCSRFDGTGTMCNDCPVCVSVQSASTHCKCDDTCGSSCTTCGHLPCPSSHWYIHRNFHSVSEPEEFF